MKVKKVLALIATVMVLTTITGFSSVVTKSKAAGPVKIVWSYGKDVTPTNKAIMDAFNKKYAGKIQVVKAELPNDTDKQHDQYVTVFNGGGSDYDVFNGDVIWPAEFAEAGYALPLDRFIARDKVNLKDYMAGPIGAVTFKGKTWGLPRFIDAGLLFYRKDIVAKAPATWEDLITQSKKLKGKTDFSFVGQFKQYEGLVCNAVEYISSYGGKVVDGNGNITINSAGTKKGLEMMKKIVGSNFVPNNITTFTETETDNAFIGGQATFTRNWPYQWAEGADKTKSKVVGKVGVAPLPKGSVKSAACLGGWCAMINKYSAHPNEAWTFLKFLSGKEGQKITAVVGGSAPTLTSLYNDPAVKKASPLFSDKNFVAGLSAAVPRPVSPIYKKLSNIMQEEISNYLGGKQNVNAAIKNMDKKMKAAVISAKN